MPQGLYEIMQAVYRKVLCRKLVMFQYKLALQYKLGVLGQLL